MKQLYPPQKRLVDQGATSLRAHGAYANCSETGTGKTITSIETCRTMGLPGLVVCPLVVVPAWEAAFEEQGVPCAGVIGWEKLRSGRSPFGSWSGKIFIWKVKDVVICFDECHKACNYKTKNASMVNSAKRQGIPLLMLSATLCEDPTEMGAVGFALGLHRSHDFIPWALRNGSEFDLWRNLIFTKCESLAREKLLDVRAATYGAGKAGRITRQDLSSHFQRSHVLDDALELDPEIAKLYTDLGDELSVVDGEIALDIKRAKENARRRGEDPASAEPTALTKLLRLRQKVEIRKVAGMLDFMESYRREGMSVAIFVCFSATLEALRERITENCSTVQGGQTPAERNVAVERFQLNQNRVILLNISAGGVGVSLHDEWGGHPRAAIISPSFSAKEFSQVLGRVDRAGSKSPSIQRVMVAANTIEQRVMEAVKTKLANMSTLHEDENIRINNLTTLNTTLTAPSHPMTDTISPTEPEVVYDAATAPIYDAEGGIVIEAPEPLAPVAEKKTRKPRTPKAPQPAAVASPTGIPSSLNENRVLVEADQGHGICPFCNHAYIKRHADHPPVCGGGHRKPEEAEEMPAHAEFGPSTLKMFEVAPMFRSRPGTNPAAEKGTRIHDALEKDTLDSLVDEERAIADKIVEGEIQVATHFGFFAEGLDVQDHKEIRVTVQWDGPEHRERRKSENGVEYWHSFPNETFGTMDRLLICGDVAIAIDYKTGRGAIDDPEINCQSQAYAAGVFQMFPQIQTIHFAFIVPVRDEILVATYARDMLPAFLLRIATIILRARTATTCNPQPGICDFCLNQATCQQLADKALLIARRYQFDGFPVPDVVHGSKVEDPEEMAVLLKLGRLMEDWGKAVKSRANYFAFEQDNEIPGFTKMSVKGKSTVLSTRGAALALAPLGLSTDDILDCSELKVTKVEEMVSERAPRGEKGNAAQAVRDTLLDGGLLSQGESSNQLRVSRK